MPICIMSRISGSWEPLYKRNDRRGFTTPPHLDLVAASGREQRFNALFLDGRGRHLIMPDGTKNPDWNRQEDVT